MSDIDKDRPTTQESAEILELEELIRAKDKAEADAKKDSDRPPDDRPTPRRD